MLFREEDRLLLSTDLIYTIDMGGHDSDPRMPTNFYNWDTEQARASVRKIAALEPAALWGGHGQPLRGDVQAQLLQVAGHS